MIFSAALDPHFSRILFLSKSQQSELLEVLVSAAKSIGCSTTRAPNDATQTVEQSSKTWSVLDCLLDHSKILHLKNQLCLGFGHACFAQQSLASYLLAFI